MTFTNKAAEEMRSRVDGAARQSDCSRMWISTFHSLCARLLRREAPAIGLSRDFVIYDSSDQLSVVKQALKALNIDDSLVQPRAALSRISHAKNTMQGPETFASGWNPRDKQIGKIYEYLPERADREPRARLRRPAAQDAGAGGEVRVSPDALLATSSGTSWWTSTRTRTGRSTCWSSGSPSIHRNICVVGDPDQSIYKWRGADLRNILDFEHDFPNPTIVRLERNYRSTQVILDAASAVISQNRNRKEKRLWTDKEGGARVLYFRGSDELEEADFITRTTRRALRGLERPGRRALPDELAVARD